MTAFIGRRELITLLGSSAAAWPVAAIAQQSQMPVVAFVNGGAADAATRYLAAFQKGLREAGYVEGQNITVEYYWLDGRYEGIPALMADLVRRQVALIATPGSNVAAVAAKAATATIPIVFGSADGPVKLGLVASFARPGGNATAVSNPGAPPKNPPTKPHARAPSIPTWCGPTCISRCYHWTNRCLPKATPRPTPRFWMLHGPFGGVEMIVSLRGRMSLCSNHTYPLDHHSATGCSPEAGATQRDQPEPRLERPGDFARCRPTAGDCQALSRPRGCDRSRPRRSGPLLRSPHAADPPICQWRCLS